MMVTLISPQIFFTLSNLFPGFLFFRTEKRNEEREKDYKIAESEQQHAKTKAENKKQKERKKKTAAKQPLHPETIKSLLPCIT
jgi:hypothetical protein